MAPPTTVLAFAQQELTRRETAHAAAETELGAAQGIQNTARVALEQRATELAQLDAELARIRAELGAVPMPADATALAGELEDAIMARRAKSAEVDAAADEAAAGQRRLEAAQADLDAASAAHALALTAAAEAQTGHDRRQGWIAALAAPPLAELGGRATTEKASARFTGAKTKLEADLPEPLRLRAAARRAAARTHVNALRTAEAAAQDDLGGLAAAHGGVLGDAHEAQIAFERAEASLGDWVRTAQERFARAVALLDLVHATPSPSPEESARTGDATLAGDGEAAADKEADRDAARAALETARFAHDEALLDALAADPDAPAAVDDTPVTDAEGELATAEAAYTQAMRGALQRWEATVPDDRWRALDAYLEASALLDELIAGPGTRAADLGTSEGTYAGRLDTAATAARAQAIVERAIRDRAAAAKAARGTAAARALAAVRGDA